MIKENVPIDSEIHRVVVIGIPYTSNASSSNLNFTLEFSFINETDDNFVIDQTSGIIRVLRALDAESASVFAWTLRVRVRMTSPFSADATCLILVALEDVNEFPPFVEKEVIKAPRDDCGRLHVIPATAAPFEYEDLLPLPVEGTEKDASAPILDKNPTSSNDSLVSHYRGSSWSKWMRTLPGVPDPVRAPPGWLHCSDVTASRLKANARVLFLCPRVRQSFNALGKQQL